MPVFAAIPCRVSYIWSKCRKAFFVLSLAGQHVFYIAYAAYHPEFSPFFLSLFRRSRRRSPCCKKCRKTLRQRRFAQFLLFFTKRKSASRNKTSLSVLPIFPSGLPASFTISLQSVRILPREPVMNGGFLSRFPKRAAQLQLQTKES